MYTIHNNELINQKINCDIDVINETILSLIGSVDAIFLTGGFGRGEGSVLFDNFQCQPINDYDLVVVTDESVIEREIVKARIDLAEKCGIRQVDIAVKQRKDLSSLKFTMANFDLVNASIMIYGTLNLKREMPNWLARDLPKEEGIIPLFLFLSAIVQSYPSSKIMSRDEIFWGYQQLTKSILGWSTAMLIFESLYHTSYASRNEIFQKHFSEFPELCSLAQQATDFKLHPTLVPCKASDYHEFWNKAREAHLDVMKSLLVKYYRVNFYSWSSLINRHRLSPKNIVKSLLSLVFRKHHYFDCLNIDLAKLYFCLSIKDENFLKKSKHYFKKVKWNKKEQTLYNTKEEYLKQLIMGDINARIFSERGSRIFYKKMH